MSRATPECAVNGKVHHRRHRRRSSIETEPMTHIGHFAVDPTRSSYEPRISLDEPDEEKGMGDILRGIMPDPDSDPVEEIRDLRRTP